MLALVLKGISSLIRTIAKNRRLLEEGQDFYRAYYTTRMQHLGWLTFKRGV